MNCSDITAMLDDSDCAALDADVQRAVGLHLTACLACRQAWSLHARLVSKALPALPAGLIEECSAMAVADATVQPRRRLWRHTGLATAVVALAAAAAIFALRPRSGSDAAGTAAVLPEQEELAVPGLNAESTSSASPAALGDAAVAERALAAQQEPVFIRVISSPAHTMNEADRAAFEAFHTAFVAALRGTPGVVLLPAEPSAEPAAAADFVLTLGAGRRIDRLRFGVDAGRSDGIMLPIRTELAEDCGACLEEATRLGQSMVRSILGMMAPATNSEVRATKLKLQDRRLRPEQRLEALHALDTRRWTANVRTALRKPDQTLAALRDPAVVREAVDLAFVAAEPAHRAEVWYTMRGIADPLLVDPLVRAAQTDPAYLVRAEATATLAADFSGNPRARAALELIARADVRSVVRALAQRGPSGESGWRSHVATSLADTSLPDAERLDAFLFDARRANGFQQLLTLLDDEGNRTLARMLTGASRAGVAASDVHVLLRYLAITQMLGDPVVRAAFEAIAASDADEESRRIAKQVLEAR
jgi:hypothetical protein